MLKKLILVSLSSISLLVSMQDPRQNGFKKFSSMGTSPDRHDDLLSNLLKQSVTNAKELQWAEKLKQANKESNQRSMPELMEAIKNNNIDKVEQLLRNGADVNLFKLSRGKTYENTWPLREAVQLGNKDIVELLIDQGAELNKADPSGFTCLHVLACNKNFNSDILEMFLEDKRTNIKNKTLPTVKTALELAESRNNRNFVERLKRYTLEKEETKTRRRNLRDPELPSVAKTKSIKKEQSSWFGSAPYFLGGMGITATIYFMYHKFFKENSNE